MVMEQKDIVTLCTEHTEGVYSALKSDLSYFPYGVIHNASKHTKI